jgi:4'-phosphopantetheinyl transferase
MMLSRSGWRLPPENRTSLAEDEVHVWRATLDQPAEFTAILEPILASDERERVRRFYFDRDRTRCLISRGLLRTLLGRYLGSPPGALRFDYSRFGKPSLAGTPLQFNVSHSGELLLIAIAHHRAVGVDVEQIRREMSVVEIAQRFFSANERTALAALAEPLRPDAFFACWTRKEAYIKARGEGLSLPLDGFDVAFLPGEAARLLATRPDPAEARRWCLSELDVADGYKAALAVEGSEWTLKCWDWPGEQAAACCHIGVEQQK